MSQQCIQPPIRIRASADGRSPAEHEANNNKFYSGEPTCHGESVTASSKWTTRFLQLASLVASWSKDPTTQVGAMATDSHRCVLESGYNGPPRGVEDLEPRFQRPAKYLWTTHAEANLVAAAAKHRLSGSTVYVTHLCCAQCAALLINSGVASVVCGPGTTSMAPEQFQVALRMFEEAGVALRLPAADPDAKHPATEREPHSRS